MIIVLKLRKRKNIEDSKCIRDSKFLKICPNFKN